MQGLLWVFSVALEHLSLQLSAQWCSLPGSTQEWKAKRRVRVFSVTCSQLYIFHSYFKLSALTEPILHHLQYYSVFSIGKWWILHHCLLLSLFLLVYLCFLYCDKWKREKWQRNNFPQKTQRIIQYYWFYLHCWHLSLILWDRSLLVNTTCGAAWTNSSLFIVVNADDLQRHTCTFVAVTRGVFTWLYPQLSPRSALRSHTHPLTQNTSAESVWLLVKHFLHELLISVSTKASEWGEELFSLSPPPPACLPQTTADKSGDCHVRGDSARTD